MRSDSWQAGTSRGVPASLLADWCGWAVAVARTLPAELRRRLRPSSGELKNAPSDCFLGRFGLVGRLDQRGNRPGLWDFVPSGAVIGLALGVPAVEHSAAVRWCEAVAGRTCRRVSGVTVMWFGRLRAGASNCRATCLFMQLAT